MRVAPWFLATSCMLFPLAVSCSDGSATNDGPSVPAGGAGGQADAGPIDGSDGGTGGTGNTGGTSGSGGSAGSATGGSAGSATGGSAGSATGGSAGSATGGSAGSATGGSAGTTTTIRVHYPASGHTISLRGSDAPLSWTAGVAFTAGQADTWTWSTQGLHQEVEWKPLLDDSTWARGPNYHITPGATVDVFPHFTQQQGSTEQLFPSFHSDALGNDRIVWVYYPAVYLENSRAVLPVLYMHDGQNLFHGHPGMSGYSWEVDTTFNDAGEHGWCSDGTICNGDGDCTSGRCETLTEVIVVAPEATSARCYEYTPTVDPSEVGTCDGGGGDLYLQLLIDELKPQVDAQLRTQPGRESTGILGSSLGGLISAYAGVGHADVFGLVGAMSPSTWWDNLVLIDDVATIPSKPVRPARVYVDSGDSQAADDGEDTNLLAQKYLDLGYVEGVDFHHVVQQGAQHSEQYWQQRFPGAAKFLFGPRTP